MLVTCPNCEARVLPKSDDSCPACGQSIPPGTVLLPLPTPPPPPLTFRDRVAARALGSSVLGLVLAIYGGFGGTYQKRGWAKEVGGIDLFRLGLGISAFAFVLFLICRRRKS